MQEKRYNAKGVGAKIGITNIALSQTLRGYPNTKTLENIAKALNVPLSSLFKKEATNTIICPHCGKEILLQPTTKE